VIFGARANAYAPLVDQVRPGHAGSQGGAGAAALPPPVACEFLSQNHGPMTSVYTETDSAARGRNIVNISFASKDRYRFYIDSPDEAERALRVIVEYLLRFGYDGHVVFFNLVYGGVSNSLGDLKRAIAREHERALYRTAEETVAAKNGLTIDQLRTAISNFKKAATEETARDSTAGQLREFVLPAGGFTTEAEVKAAPARAELSAQQLAAEIDDSTLGHRRRRFEKRLREIELPEGGFTTKEQAGAAALLATTLRELQKLERELGLPVTETPKRVREAEAMASAYRRSHDDETGEVIPPRPRGRPRRAPQPQSPTVSALL